MALPTNGVSTVFVEATFTDPLGVVTEVASQQVTNVSAPVLIYRTQLASSGPGTDNVITVPSTARGVIITSEILCDNLKTLKGVGGDTGIRIFNTTAPYNSGSMMLVFGTPPPASFIINCILGTNPDPGYTEFCFF